VTRRGGFTLIEVLAVVLLTGLVIGVATDFYLDLSRASNRAVLLTRDSRRAASVLDRIARDVQSAVLVKRPEDADPSTHPWIFLAESQASELGSDRLKFVTRNHEPRSTGMPEVDLAVVAYTLRSDPEDPEAGLQLWRWESAYLPESFDRSFPAEGAPGDVLLADGIAAFGVTFVDQKTERHVTWDSSLVAEGRELPVIVEVQLALVEPGEPKPLEDLTIYRRRTQTFTPPLDLAELLDPNSGNPQEADKLAGKTVCDCLDCAKLSANPSTAMLLREIGGHPAANWVNDLPRHLHKEVLPACR
jgi:prepilin-type N-terminal cleavage/methylation domain-containing protein